MDPEATLSGLLNHPGEVFPSVLKIVLLATVGVALLHLVLALLGGRTSRPHRRLRIWEKLIYLGVLLSVAGLAFTSYFSVLRFGEMRGWWLFAHMFGAGSLVALLPLMAVVWAAPSRFGRAMRSDDEETYSEKFFWLPKLMFWLFLASSLVTIFSMLLSMLPLFGTDGLHELLDVHRYAGLLAVVTLFFHFYCLMLQRAKLR